jgi:hypothetical protein
VADRFQTASSPFGAIVDVFETADAQLIIYDRRDFAYIHDVIDRGSADASGFPSGDAGDLQATRGDFQVPPAGNPTR